MRFLKLLSFTLMLSILGLLPAFPYAITFSTGSGDGTSASTSTACSAIVSEGSSYLSGNLATATKIYYSGSSGLKMGTSSVAGVIKMNLASSVTPTSIVVSAKLYNSSKAATLKVNGSATQSITADFSDLTFNITSATSYLELQSSKYCWIQSITVNTSGGSTTTCATPTFTPAAGSYEGTQSVTISCETDGTTIYYTTDGTAPSTSSSVYSAPIAVSADMTIKAYAVKEGLTDSEVAEAAYTITKAPDVTLDLVDGNWGFPSANSTSLSTYTNSQTGYAVQCYAADAYKVSVTSYFLIGKKNSYMLLPKFDNAVDKIVVVGNSTGSGSVVFNIYDGDNAASTAVTGCTSDKTFVITDPEPEKQYAIKVTSAHNLQMKQIKIYFGAAPVVAKPTLSGNTSFLTSTIVALGCTTDGATIYYTTDGTDPQTSSTKQVYTDPFELTATTTVKVKANKGDDWSALNSKQFVKVVPISVATALTAIDALADNGEIADQFVSGVISQIDSYNSSYHSITYWISDDGTTTNQLKVYGGLAGVVKSAFESKDDLTVGADVTIFGKLKKYKSGSNITPEFDSNNEIAAYKPLARLAWSADSYTANKGGNNTFPTLTNTDQVTVTYSSDNAAASFTDASDYSTLQLNSVAPGVTITASFAGNETLKANSVSYTLNIEENVARGTISFNVDGGEAITSIPDATALPDPLPVPTKAGKNFVKWYTDSEKTTEAVAGAAVTTDITLFAEWRSPYSVTEALAIIENLGNNTGIENDVYVAGIVSTAPTANPSSGRLTYSISIDGTASEEIKVYLGKGLNNAAFNEKTDIDVADQVVVYGKLYKYEKSGDITSEVNTPNYLYSYIRPSKAVTGVTLPATASVRTGNTITLTATIEPSNASNKNVTWSVIAGSDYAEVDANGVVTGKTQGSATIQIETEDGGFTATCEVTVAAAAPTFDDPDHEWIKVSNDAKLVAGRYYVIASDEKDKVAGTTLTSGYLADVSASFSDGVIAYNGFGSSKAAIAGGAAVFELGGEAGAWTLTEVSEEKVLTGATTQNLAWDGANNRTWAITISDGVATIGAAAGYYIRHNYGSNRFKPYSGTQTSMKVPQLYMWAELSHIVSFDANGGVAESVPEVERTDEGKIIIPAKTPTHTDAAKVFGGWYVTSAPGTLYNVGDEFSTDADVTLYAKWNSVPTHTVTYVPGGTGTGIPAVTSYAEGVKVKVVTVTDLANPGYLFTGWVVKDADQNVIDVDENNEFIMPTSNVTITAGWERQSSQKWALVKQGEELELNAEYVIACTSKSVALGTINTGGSAHYGNSVEVAINGEILKGSSAMVAFTLVAGNADDSYAFKNGNNYLMWSSGNSLDEKTTLDNSSSWTIEVGEDDVAAIANIGTSGRALKYNSGSPRFACYTSDQTVVQLYKKVLAATVTASDATEASVPDNADVTVKDGGVLTINNEKTIGDLIIEQGGKVVLDEKKLTVVGVFSIETTMGSGASGQLNGVTVANFEASEAYIDITLGDNANPNKWHAFTVPFPVDVLNGIFDLADNKLQNEVNYAIMDYHGDIRATGKYGWKKIRTTLVPGTFYIMATDGYRTTYRFKKADGAALVAANTKDLHEYPLNGGTDEQHDNGWNGVGNPTLHYGTANQVVQVLNPNTYTYEEFLVGAKNFVVGTPFFVQAAADGTMTFSAEDETKPYYAPARYSSEEIKDVEVRFGNEEYTDRLYISANEDALSTYETGKDLIKMTMTNTPKVAQIFGNAYNSKLCMVNAPLRNDQANFSLKLYAPADGEYTITIPEVDNADIYLTYDNRIIWNIAASEYNCELKAGETNNYGLILRMKAPQVTTGVEQGGVSNGANSVQKIIINDHVYILRGEKLYDVTGKMLR